jgi:hypothetical protein
MKNETDPSLHGDLNYLNDIDKSLNESITNKNKDISHRLHREFVRLLFLQTYVVFSSQFKSKALR